MTGGEKEGDGELLAETDEVVYECGARQRHPILFPQPIRLQANRWYLAWARVSGPSSDCGSSGQSTVTTEDQLLPPLIAYPFFYYILSLNYYVSIFI